jgi:hypothetical protein
LSLVLVLSLALANAAATLLYLLLLLLLLALRWLLDLDAARADLAGLALNQHLACLRRV